MECHRSHHVQAILLKLDNLLVNPDPLVNQLWLKFKSIAPAGHVVTWQACVDFYREANEFVRFAQAASRAVMSSLQVDISFHTFLSAHLRAAMERRIRHTEIGETVAGSDEEDFKRHRDKAIGY